MDRKITQSDINDALSRLCEEDERGLDVETAPEELNMDSGPSAGVMMETEAMKASFEEKVASFGGRVEWKCGVRADRDMPFWYQDDVICTVHTPEYDADLTTSSPIYVYRDGEPCDGGEDPWDVCGYGVACDADAEELGFSLDYDPGYLYWEIRPSDERLSDVVIDSYDYGFRERTLSDALENGATLDVDIAEVIRLELEGSGIDESAMSGKKRRKAPKGATLKTDAGDVEANVAHFNMAMGSAGDCSESVSETGGLVVDAAPDDLLSPFRAQSAKESHGSFVVAVPNASGVVSGFSNDEKLTEVDVAATAKAIGDRAFADCKSLSSVTIPNSVTSIGDRAFFRCKSLISAVIPDSVKTIGYHAFQYCSSLASVTIPNSVTYIGDDAFSDCYALASVTIPNSVTSIGDCAFSGCVSLTSITIPNSVASIGDRAFACCDSLTSITIPDSVTSIGYGAFYNCRSLTSITIPNSVASIGDYAFYNCESLTSITIPVSVKTIGNHVFSCCDSLSSITIPSSVKTIGGYAFQYCYSLASVTIPNSVTSIGNHAFTDCYSLRDVYFAGDEASWRRLGVDLPKRVRLHFSSSGPTGALRESGYDGYSMSNNARAAYANDEKPLSKWSKEDIIGCAAAIDAKKAELLRKVPLEKLRYHLLSRTSWHHTSSYYNKTDFYSFDGDAFENVQEDDIDRWVESHRRDVADKKKEKDVRKTRKGRIDYLVWYGSRAHPRASEEHLDNVNIEERGSFYLVTDDSGREILRKKIGSNGTRVRFYESVVKDNLMEEPEKHRTLNPKLWDVEDNALKPEVSERIGAIVDDFCGGLDDNDVRYRLADVRLVGSNCSYNYTEKSDLDVHIVFDLSIYDDAEKEQMAETIYNYARSLWCKAHSVEFYGIPVEVFVETNNTVDLNDSDAVN